LNWVNLAGLFCAGVVLSACVATPPPPKPGQYGNYREMALDRANKVFWRGVPEDLQQRAKSCAVDLAVEWLTPGELQKLDAYARGEGGLTESDVQRMDHDVSARMGGSTGVQAKMEQTCPDTVRDIKAWRAANPA